MNKHINKKVLAGFLVLFVGFSSFFVYKYFNDNKKDEVPFSKEADIVSSTTESFVDKSKVDKVVNSSIKLSKTSKDNKARVSYNILNKETKEGSSSKIVLPKAIVKKDGHVVKDVKYNTNLYTVKPNENIDINLSKFKKVKDVDSIYSDQLKNSINRKDDVVNIVKVNEDMTKDVYSKITSLGQLYSSSDLKSVSGIITNKNVTGSANIHTDKDDIYNEFLKKIVSLHEKYDTTIKNASAEQLKVDFPDDDAKNPAKDFRNALAKKYDKLYPNHSWVVDVDGRITKPIVITDPNLLITLNDVGIDSKVVSAHLTVTNNTDKVQKLKYPLIVTVDLPLVYDTGLFASISLIPDVAQPESLSPGESYDVIYSTSTYGFAVNKDTDIRFNFGNITDSKSVENVIVTR